jgi:hypothetical protein
MAISKKVNKVVIDKAMAAGTVLMGGLSHQQRQHQSLQDLQEPVATLTTPLNMLNTTVDKIRMLPTEATRTMLHTISTTNNKPLSSKVRKALPQGQHLLLLQRTMHLRPHHLVVLRPAQTEGTIL